MQVFKFQFNPKEEKYSNTFSFEPENSYEKSLGNLYMAGELENANPINIKLLEKISQNIKKKYYGASFKKPNKALAESLKSGNEFLSEEIKKENVGWLGNLNFATLAIKNLELSFTATGNLKLLLLRSGQINDISKDLNATEIEPFPLKVFFNVVSGKLAENDIVLAVSKELLDFLNKKKVIEKLANSEMLTEKKLKEILPIKMLEEEDISGVCLIIDLCKTSSKAREITLKKPELSFISKLTERLKAFKIPKKKVAIPISIKKPGFKMPKAEIFKESPDFKKNTVLILALIVILIMGFTIFKKNEEIKRNEIAAEAAIKKSEEEKLYAASNIKRIDNPEVLTDIDIKSLEFVPQTLLISGYQMYLSSSISPNLYIFDLNTRKGNVFKYSQNLELSDDSSSIILFFSRPDKVITFEKDNFKEQKITLPEEKLDFDIMSSYASNIYFLNREKNEIMKYSYSYDFKWGSPKLAFSPKQKAKYLAIDSYFWVLNEDDKIDVYFKGEYLRTITFDIFPKIKGITKIKTKAGLPYLYMLEPANNRLIITDKNGQLIEQIQSEKFDNLKDFSISYNGTTIWILNGEQIFQVEM